MQTQEVLKALSAFPDSYDAAVVNTAQLRQMELSQRSVGRRRQGMLSATISTDLPHRKASTSSHLSIIVDDR